MSLSKSQDFLIWGINSVVRGEWCGEAGYSWRMRVTVLYFGVLREVMGSGGGVVEVRDGVTVGEFVRELGASNESKVWGSVAVAVNREYAGKDLVLREGDEVAVLPPVSGGSAAKDWD